MYTWWDVVEGELSAGSCAIGGVFAVVECDEG